MVNTTPFTMASITFETVRVNEIVQINRSSNRCDPHPTSCKLISNLYIRLLRLTEWLKSVPGDLPCCGCPCYLHIQKMSLTGTQIDRSTNVQRIPLYMYYVLRVVVVVVSVYIEIVSDEKSKYSLFFRKTSTSGAHTR